MIRPLGASVVLSIAVLTGGCTSLKDDPTGPSDAGQDVVPSEAGRDAGADAGDATVADADASEAASDAHDAADASDAADDAADAADADDADDAADAADAADAPDTTPADPCAFPSASDPNLYVAATATQGVGGPLCPFRTITQALDAARLRPLASQVIHVAAGTYDNALGESFPIRVGDGVSLVGAGAGVTIIQGSAFIGQTDTTYWSKYEGTIILGSSGAPSSIKALTVLPDPSLVLATIRSTGEDVVGIQCETGTSPGEGQPLPPPSSVISDVELGPGFVDSVKLVGTAQGCNLQVLHSVFHAGSPLDFSNGVALAGAGCGGYTRDVLPVGLRVGDGTAAGRNTFEVGTTASHSAAAIVSIGCVSEVVIDDNEIHGGDLGIYLHNELPLDGSVLSYSIRNNTFEALGTGIDVQATGSAVRLTNNVFRNIGGPVRADGYPAALAVGSESGWFGGRVMDRGFPGALVARGNQFIGGDVGVWIHGVSALPLSSGNTLDFGTPGSHGNNDFRCNASTGHGDIVIDTATTGAPVVSLAGNGWDHATPSQIVGPSTPPKGTDIDVSSSPAPTLDTSAAYVSTAACPTGGTP